MSTPTNTLTLRQMLEGMTLNFDNATANGLKAAIQFNITKPEAGVYHLHIANGDCTFHLGAASEPTLTITTPSDVWLKISQGELNSQEALRQGLYQVNGDFSLLLQMSTLFKARADTSGATSVYAAPPDQRPAGPIKLAGMAWLTMAFIPWIIFWVTFNIHSITPLISVGLPFVISLLLVGYRLVYNKPTLMEIGGLGFFAAAGMLTLAGNAQFALWGVSISQVVMAMLWFGSLVFADMPLCAEYSKWGYAKKLWRTTFFIHPNVVISLVWGWLFIVLALWDIVVVSWANGSTLLAASRYALIIPAQVFTSVYPRGAGNRPVANIDRTLARMRTWPGVGLAATAGLILVIWFGL